MGIIITVIICIIIIIFILSWVYAVANGNTAIYIFLGVFWSMILIICIIDRLFFGYWLYNLISAFYVRKLGEASTRIDQFKDYNYSNWGNWGISGFLFLILITCVFAGLFIRYTGNLPTSIGKNDIRLLYPGIGVFIGYSILLFMVFCLMIGLWMFMNREYKADINWENQLRKLGIFSVDNAKLFKNFGEKDNAAALALLNNTLDDASSNDRYTILAKIQERITAAENAIPYSIQFKYGILLLFIGIFFSFVVGFSYSKTSLTDVPLGSIQQPTTITAPPSTTPTPQLSMDLSPFFPPVVDQGDTDICQTYDVIYYIGSYYYAVSAPTVGGGTRPSNATQADGRLIRTYSEWYGSPSDTTNANLFNPLYNWLYSVSVAPATLNNRCSTGVFKTSLVYSTQAPDYEEIDPQQNYNIIKDISNPSLFSTGIGCMTNANTKASVPTRYDNPKVDQSYTNNSKSLSEKYSIVTSQQTPAPGQQGLSRPTQDLLCPGSPDYGSVVNTNKKYPFLNMKYNVLYYYSTISSGFDSTYMTVVNNTTTFSQNTFLPLIKAQLNDGIPLQCIIKFNSTTPITNNPRDIFDSFYQRNTEVFPSVSSNCIVKNMTRSGSGSSAAGHSMVIVGYSEDPNVNDQTLYGGGVIKFINSWGTSWGTERGFLYMSYACFFKDYNTDNGIVQRINYIS